MTCCLIVLLTSNVEEHSIQSFLYIVYVMSVINEPSRGKTNNVVSEQVRHKPGCTATEDR